MDFLATARLLMDIQRDHPSMSYEFVDNMRGPAVLINIPVGVTVASDFDAAARMFEVAE